MGGHFFGWKEWEGRINGEVGGIGWVLGLFIYKGIATE